MRYRLRTLLIALAQGPPILAVAWFVFTLASGMRELERRRHMGGNGLRQIGRLISTLPASP
jgi:hypothetical protein